MNQFQREERYAPPPASRGGWRVADSDAAVRALGLDPDGLAAFGRANMAVPSARWQPWSDHMAALVIVDGWIVGEWYREPAARAFRQYLASNGKAFAMACMGIVAEDARAGEAPADLDLTSPVYDPRWMPEGLPLSDKRKTEITWDQVFLHRSGLCPEAEEAGRYQADKSFSRWVVGRDPVYRETASLYYDPGHPEQYQRQTRHLFDTYSSIGLQHVGLALPHLTGLQAHEFLLRRLLRPIGCGSIGYMQPVQEWSAGDENVNICWHTDGGLCLTPRDYARFAYLLLHDGRWGERQIVPQGWLRHFRTSASYANILDNSSGLLGSQYPGDMFRIAGSGLSWAFMVPSLNLVALRTGRSDNHLRPEVQDAFLRTLFAALL